VYLIVGSENNNIRLVSEEKNMMKPPTNIIAFIVSSEFVESLKDMKDISARNVRNVE
jgi:hypothetical protein